MPARDGPFAAFYFSIPVVTRTYLTLAVLTSVACALDVVSPWSLYLSLNLVWTKREWWRLGTTFLFFGPFGIDFIFHMYFLHRYSAMLEESAFRGRTADYTWFLAVGAAAMLAVASLLNLYFLSMSLVLMVVYVWGRRNEHVRMSFLGLVDFTAPYLPWVLTAFSVALGNSPTADLVGIAVGHLYYFFEDVYPRMSGRRPLRTPRLLQRLFGQADDAYRPSYVPHPQFREPQPQQPQQ